MSQSNNIKHFPSKAKGEVSLFNVMIEQEHIDQSSMIKEMLDIELYEESEKIWDKYIPKALASKIYSQEYPENWVNACSRLLRPELEIEAQKIWDSLIPLALEEGRFHELHKHRWEDYCKIRAYIETLRTIISDKGCSYETGPGRNGNQIRTRPEAQELERQMKYMNELVSELGLGVKSELKLKAAGAVQTALDFDWSE